MENKIKNNLKIDKRIRAIFGEVELGSVTSSPASTREGIMADQDSEQAKQGRAVLEWSIILRIIKKLYLKLVS